MAGFGFSISDIVLVSQFAVSVYNSSKNAGEDFRSISDDVRSFQSSLSQLQMEAENPKSLIHQSSAIQQQELNSLLESCHSSLQRINKTLRKYQSLKKSNARTRDRLGFTADKQAKIRDEISRRSDRLNRFLNGLHVGALGRIEHNGESQRLSFDEIRAKLNVIHQDVLAGKRDGSILTDIGNWSILEQELIDDDITEIDVETNKDEIERWLEFIRIGNDPETMVKAILEQEDERSVADNENDQNKNYEDYQISPIRNEKNAGNTNVKSTESLKNATVENAPGSDDADSPKASGSTIMSSPNSAGKPTEDPLSRNPLEMHQEDQKNQPHGSQPEKLDEHHSSPEMDSSPIPNVHQPNGRLHSLMNTDHTPHGLYPRHPSAKKKKVYAYHPGANSKGIQDKLARLSAIFEAQCNDQRKRIAEMEAVDKAAVEAKAQRDRKEEMELKVVADYKAALLKVAKEARMKAEMNAAKKAEEFYAARDKELADARAAVEELKKGIIDADLEVARFRSPDPNPETQENESVEESSTTILPLLVSPQDIFLQRIKRVRTRRMIWDGKGTIISSEWLELDVQLHRFMETGSIVSYQGRGNQFGSEIRDLHIYIVEEMLPWRRKGHDLFYTLEMNLLESLCGRVVHIPMIDGSQHITFLPGPIQPNTKLRFPGLGLHKGDDDKARGDMLVEVQVKYPSRLSPEQLLELNCIFGGEYKEGVPDTAIDGQLKNPACVSCFSPEAPLSKLGCGHNMCQRCRQIKLRRAILNPGNVPLICCGSSGPPIILVFDENNKNDGQYREGSSVDDECRPQPGPPQPTLAASSHLHAHEAISTTPGNDNHQPQAPFPCPPSSDPVPKQVEETETSSSQEEIGDGNASSPTPPAKLVARFAKVAFSPWVSPYAPIDAAVAPKPLYARRSRPKRK